VLKSTFVARFKLHRGLTVMCSVIGNKNIPPIRYKQLEIRSPRDFMIYEDNN